MRISGTTGTVLALVALAALGGGTYFFRTGRPQKAATAKLFNHSTTQSPNHLTT